MKQLSTPLTGLRVVETEPFQDARGSFERLFCAEAWAPLREELHFLQVNLSTTIKCGTIRGMHFQRAPAAEAKLIRCVRGHVYDVAIDLRADSPTFLRWHAIELREDDAREIFIPEGFGHGFQALSDNVQMLYFHTKPWAQTHECGIRYDDPMIAIDWPLVPTDISDRDRSHPLLDSSFAGCSV